MKLNAAHFEPTELNATSLLLGQLDAAPLEPPQLNAMQLSLEQLISTVLLALVQTHAAPRFINAALVASA